MAADTWLMVLLVVAMAGILVLSIWPAWRWPLAGRPWRRAYLIGGASIAFGISAIAYDVVKYGFERNPWIQLVLGGFFVLIGITRIARARIERRESEPSSG